MKKLLWMLVALAVLFISSFASANAETTYTYYWGNGCGYCANVNAYLKWVEDESLIKMEKKEIYFNKNNAKDMSEEATRLWIDPTKLGVPFLIINEDWKETYLTWDKPIIEHFKPILWEAKESNNKTVILIILGLLAVIIPFFIIKGGSKK